jgi:hypothetical protein
MLKILGFHSFKNHKMSYMNDRDIQFFAAGINNVASLTIFFTVHRCQYHQSKIRAKSTLSA